MMGERKESGDEDSIKVQPVATSLHSLLYIPLLLVLVMGGARIGLYAL